LLAGRPPAPPSPPVPAARRETSPEVLSGLFPETLSEIGEALVIDRVVERMEELWGAARVLPPLVGRHDLSLDASREAIQVACAFLTIPRAYLEGLLESRRYRHLE
ncbi:hypothetical protein ACFQ08_08970, partial [Streptosporangium algeriense]